MKISNLSIFLFLAPVYVSAQWESTHGPFGSYINDLGQNDQFVFAATTAGLYRSDDIGLTWEIKPFFSDVRYPCLQFDVRDSLLIADAVEIRPDSIIRHMYKSMDNGESWIEIPRPHVEDWVDVAIVGTTVFAYDHRNIWITENDGLTWFQSLINHDVRFPDGFNHYGENVFVGDSANLYIYSGDDTNWEKIKIPLAESVASVYAFDSILLVRDYDKEKLFVSDDFGKTWFTSVETQFGAFENYFARIGDTLYATYYETMYTSVDQGHTWEARYSKGMDWAFNMIAVDNVLLSGYQYSGMFRSTDFGRSFHYSSDGIDASYVQSLFVYGDQLLSGGYVHGVFNYDLTSREWQQTYFNENARLLCHDMDTYDGKLFLTGSGEVYRYDTLSGSWGHDGPEQIGFYLFTDFYQSPYGLLAGGNQDGYFGTLHIYDPSNYWDELYIEIEGDALYPIAFAQHDQYYFLAETSRLARSDDGGLNWTFLPDMLEPDLGVLDLKVIDGVLYLIQSDDFVIHTRLTVSYDNGNTWQLADDGIPIDGNYSGIRNVIEVGDYLLCFTLGHSSGIYYSRKENLQWQPFNDGLPYLSVKDIAYDGEFLYAASTGQGVWKRKAQELFLTSHEEPAPMDDIHIFPNPASEQFTIQLPGIEHLHGSLSIYDIQGKLVMEKPDADFEDRIKVANIPDGFYWIEVQTKLRTYSSKLVIQH